ncbi:hypothetical protein JIX56_01275 [Streptomyces sp. CA-210063]|nr:hypothetical protein JIX56_01275 [Streptomyces sp. CA-210063]
MSTLDFTVLDRDFPAGSKNKAATLVTGENEALLVDTGFTHADGHRLAAEILDCGKKLTYGGKLRAWAALGQNLLTRLVVLAPLTSDLNLEGHRFEFRGGPAGLPDRHYLRQAEHRALFGGVLLFQQDHVWVAETPTPGDRSVWITLLDGTASLEPELVVPGHHLPGTPAGASAITATRGLPHRLRRGTRHGHGRCRPHRHPHQALSRQRHADRRTDRRQGLQSRDDVGLIWA